MHPRAHTRQFAPVQVVPVQELKRRRAAWHHTRPERPRITNPGGPDMHSPQTAPPPPQTRHSALAVDVPAVAARPIYTYGTQTHASRHTVSASPRHFPRWEKLRQPAWARSTRVVSDGRASEAWVELPSKRWHTCSLIPRALLLVLPRPLSVVPFRLAAARGWYEDGDATAARGSKT